MILIYYGHTENAASTTGNGKCSEGFPWEIAFCILAILKAFIPGFRR
jgi:hypothetical protein